MCIHEEAFTFGWAVVHKLQDWWSDKTLNPKSLTSSIQLSTKISPRGLIKWHLLLLHSSSPQQEGVHFLFILVHDGYKNVNCIPWCSSDTNKWKKCRLASTQQKDSQGLVYIVKAGLTPLIHLIHFSQLSFFYEYTEFKFVPVCPSWHSKPGASPSISAKRGKI